MARVRHALKWMPLMLLSACASAPSHVPGPAKFPVQASLRPPPTFDPQHVQDHLDAELMAQASADPTSPWKRLRDSFAMADCDADPSVEQWAHRYTRNAANFEHRLRLALPKISYIQEVATRHEVPGEFVLLPWVESRFQVDPEKRGGSAGIWQIMPKTASSMGLRMNRHYDGRLDLQASSNAVMKLLARYHRQFRDWRMAGYAFNAGEFATARFVNKQSAPMTDTIPEWAGHDVAEQHLSKLLAIACVVRDPARFGVSLPSLAADQRLTPVPVAGKIAFGEAARRSGMSVAALKQFNAAFLDDVVDTRFASQLLMPAARARQFLATAGTQADVPTARDATTPGHLSAVVTKRRHRSRGARSYRIHGGESLWEIARRHAVTVQQLRRWNHLHGDVLHPGEILQVSPVEPFGPN